MNTLEKILLIVLVLFNAACTPPPAPPVVDNYQASNTNAIYIGDSNGTDQYLHRDYLAWRIAGIMGDVKSGRKLIDIGTLENYPQETIFLALGINDAAAFVDFNAYGQHLTDLLGSTDATVYCVLPALTGDSLKYNYPPYANEMLNRCTNTINPKDYGVVVQHIDAVHWLRQDNANFLQAIIERLL